MSYMVQPEMILATWKGYRPDTACMITDHISRVSMPCTSSSRTRCKYPCTCRSTKLLLLFLCYLHLRRVSRIGQEFGQVKSVKSSQVKHVMLCSDSAPKLLCCHEIGRIPRIRALSRGELEVHQQRPDTKRYSPALPLLVRQGCGDWD